MVKKIAIQSYVSVYLILYNLEDFVKRIAKIAEANEAKR